MSVHTKMKKCVICEEEASFAIKETTDYYCKECAEEQFGDVSYLIAIDETQEKNVDAKPIDEQ